MKKKTAIVWIIVFAVLILFVWAGRQYYFQENPPEKITNETPVPVLPEAPKEIIVNAPTPEPPQEKDTTELNTYERHADPQSISMDKKSDTENSASELSQHSMSIRREKEKSYELMEGVTVDKNAIHVQLDEDNTRTIEIEKDPPNSNNQFQVLVKKKF